MKVKEIIEAIEETKLTIENETNTNILKSYANIIN